MNTKQEAKWTPVEDVDHDDPRTTRKYGTHEKKTECKVNSR